VLRLDRFEMPDQGCHQRPRQHRPPIAPPLAITNQDLEPLEIEVLHSQGAAFEQPQSAPVHESGHQRADTAHSHHHPRHLVASQHDRKTNGTLRPHYVRQPVERPVQNNCV